MKYVKSTTQKEWVAAGKVIPACVTKDNRYLKIEDEEWNKIAEIPVIKALIKSGGIFVSDKTPTDLQESSTELKVTNAELKAEIAQLKAQLKTQLMAQEGNPVLEAKVTELRTLLDAKEKEVTELLAAKETEVEALKQEALAELAKKDEEIAKLKKKASNKD